MSDPLTFANPRTHAVIDNWPNGRYRCRAEFSVESHPTRGQRVARRTTKKDGATWNKPRRTTYAARFAIVDGSDGRTYLLSVGPFSVAVHHGNCQHVLRYIRPGEPDYQPLVDLVRSVPL